MIWSCFAAAGPGQLAIFEGKLVLSLTMNSKFYQTFIGELQGNTPSPEG